MRFVYAYAMAAVLLFIAVTGVSCSRITTLQGRVVSSPQRWRSYYDFYVDTDYGRKKISIKGAARAPYNKLITKGRFINITGVSRRKLNHYIIELEEDDIEISISLLK